MPLQHLWYIPLIFAFGLVTAFTIVYARHTSGTHSAHWPVRGWWVFVALVLAVAVFAATHLPVFSGGHGAVRGSALFDQNPAFDAAEVYQRLEAFGQAGREAYQRMTFSGDLVFPLSVLTFLLLLAAHVAHRRKVSARASRLLLALPVVWFASDMVENTVIFTLIGAYPQPLPIASWLAAVTVAKFSLLLASIMAPLALLIRHRP